MHSRQLRRLVSAADASIEQRCHAVREPVPLVVRALAVALEDRHPVIRVGDQGQHPSTNSLYAARSELAVTLANSALVEGYIQFRAEVRQVRSSRVADELQPAAASLQLLSVVDKSGPERSSSPVARLVR